MVIGGIEHDPGDGDFSQQSRGGESGNAEWHDCEGAKGEDGQDGPNGDDAPAMSNAWGNVSIESEWKMIPPTELIFQHRAKMVFRAWEAAVVAVEHTPQHATAAAMTDQAAAVVQAAAAVKAVGKAAGLRFVSLGRLRKTLALLTALSRRAAAVAEEWAAMERAAALVEQAAARWWRQRGRRRPRRKRRWRQTRRSSIGVVSVDSDVVVTRPSYDLGNGGTGGTGAARA